MQHHLLLLLVREVLELEKLKIGHKYQIHSYKHNGQIYKAWDEATLLNFDFKKGVLVFANNCTTVTEKDGHTWKTKEPAILFFFLHKWYNIIGQYKGRGICYYCNMASPIIIEENTIKSIIKKDLSRVSIVGNGIIRNIDAMKSVLDIINKNKLDMLEFDVSESKISITFKNVVDDEILEEIQSKLLEDEN